MSSQKKYTKEMMDYIYENYKGKSSIELASLVSKKFNIEINNDKLQNVKSNMRRRYGYVFTEKARNDGCKQKGSIPFNKGKKWDEYLTKEQQEKAKTTWFKKGNISHNKRPLGSERINRDGFIEVKVLEPNVWMTKNRVVWEQHNGKIPKGHKVIYLDGNKLNNDISNLKLISDAEELIMNRRKLRYNNKDLTESGHLIAQIIHTRGQKASERL